MSRLTLDPSLRREGSIGIAAGFLSGVPLAIEVLRAHWGMTTFARPDRVVGWSGDPLALPIGILWLAAIVAVAAFGAMLWQRRHGRPGVAATIALAAAACSSAVMQIATVDAHMYTSSPVRGFAAVAVTVAWPVAMGLVAWTLWRLRRRVVAVLSGGVALFCAWGATYIAEIAALNGGHQPSVDAALGMQAAAATWLVATAVVLATGPAVAVRLPRRAALGTGAAVAVLSVAVAVSLVSALLPRARAIAPVLASELSGRTTVETIQVAGLERVYRVHRPATPAAHPPLVIALHPVFGSGFQMEQQLAFDPEADTRGWLVAYPDGVLDGWDAFGSTDYWGRHPGADDIAFLSDMVDRLAVSDAIDLSRIYVTGFSRGGLMTYRVGCDLRQHVAAIAPISGNMATAGGSADVPCAPGHPVSVLAIHGTADGAIPINGGHVDIDYSPLADVIAKWRSIDACATTATARTEGRNTFTAWDCAGGSTVETWIVKDGGHGIPPDAPARIAEFFAAHPLADGPQQLADSTHPVADPPQRAAG